MAVVGDLGAVDDVRVAVTHELMLAGRRWRARLNEVLKPVGQTDARCSALMEIASSPDGIPQRELSVRLGVEDPTIVRLVDALEAQGWVERRSHVSDRRVKVVQLKSSARPVLQEAQQLVARAQEDLLGDLDPADLAACLRVLEQVSRRLKR